VPAQALGKVAEHERVDFANCAVNAYLDAGLRLLALGGGQADEERTSKVLTPVYIRSGSFVPIPIQTNRTFY
jgi:hypothetical protein